MIKIDNAKDCCGCTACASICNHDAISMKPDALGFQYPVVDKDKCTDCGLCEKVCAFNSHYDTTLNIPAPLAYGVRHKNINEVLKSRSGAAFVALSDYILENGGVVYGAGYTDHFRVVHKRATTKEERDEFRGSKYVQSDLTGIFRSIRKDLKEGRTVLFSGTGCQTAGLNSFIGKKLKSNLILVDIVCHGVPGPFLWRDYLAYIEEKKGETITEVNFRNKQKFGWSAHRETYRYTGCKNEETTDTSFYKRIMMRHSCSICYFCNTKRPSDITIADFWGWDRQGIELNRDDKGLNLVLLNTEKGIQFLEKIKNNLILFDADKECYLQPNLCRPTEAHPFRNIFEQDYIKKGFGYVISYDYDHPSIINRIRKKINDLCKQ